MRRSLVIGNWKLNGTRAGAKELAAEIVKGLGKTEADIAICVPYVRIPELSQQLEGTSLALGAQNVADQESGAYTGEISSAMLAEFQCKYALVGHSERRSYYGDTNESIAARFCQALNANIIPVLCIGETLEQREQEQTFQVIEEQLSPVIEQAGIAEFSKAVVAYEPVWAIGTGMTASDEQAQEVHQYIRKLLSEKDAEIAANMQILYGGSVKPDNAKALFSMADIDGGLIGGASLDAQSFLSIFHSA